MDGERFDRWTQKLGNGLPRRGALKGLAGVALIGAALRPSALRVAADNGEQVGDFCDKQNPCKDPLVCVSHECQKKDDSTKCEGNGCKKKGKKKKKKGKGGHSGGGAIHDPAY